MQMYRTRHLIDVLPPRPLGAHGGDLDFMQGDLHMGVYSQHKRITHKFELAEAEFARPPTLAASAYQSGSYKRGRVQ